MAHVKSKQFEKIWFILVEGEEEGPYSFDDLKRDWRINEETLARKKGQKEWLPIKKIRELKKLFKKEDDEGEEENEETLKSQEVLVATQQKESPPFLDFLVLLLIAFLLWLIFHVFS